MNTQENVNLARKLRPKTFDQVIGQGLSIKILQNSLYLKKYFPVYLFAGQRGCGKTTTARIFAAAVNCYSLTLFQQNPSQHPMPCLTCGSCLAMAEGSHPDFIEIDAASHTGVDHVRQIIESAAYVPLLGQKKVYLIDEAHMLSKAAFNAFLKILEEPPQTVLFMLATTERNKIPETVLSRCFQLSFTSIEHAQLRAYLAGICREESIDIEDQALDLVIEETDGSARDALNVLEQLRFSQTAVTQETIVNLLGKVSSSVIIKLVTLVIEQKPAEFLLYMQNVIATGCSAQLLWELMIELLRSLLWIKNGVQDVPNHFARHSEEITSLAALLDQRRLHSMLSFLWEHELLFLQTAQKHVFLEMLLLSLCNNTFTSGSEGSYKPPMVKKTAPAAMPTLVKQAVSNTMGSLESQQTPSIQKTETIEQTVVLLDEKSAVWHNALTKIIETNSDAFLHAVLKQAKFVEYQQNTGMVRLQLSNNGSFFKDKIRECLPSFKAVMTEYFPGFTGIDFAETNNAALIKSLPPKPTSTPGSTAQKTNNDEKAKSQASGMRTLNVDDKEQWPSANILLNHFPGVIKIEE